MTIYLPRVPLLLSCSLLIHHYASPFPSSSFLFRYVLVRLRLLPTRRVIYTPRYPACPPLLVSTLVFPFAEPPVSAARLMTRRQYLNTWCSVYQGETDLPAFHSACLPLCLSVCVARSSYGSGFALFSGLLWMPCVSISGFVSVELSR